MEDALKKALAGEGFFAFPGLLLLKGPDAFSFLQGQATRDLGRFQGPAGVLFLNHKGQIEEAATLFPHPEGFLLAPWGTLMGLKARLERYIIFDQVELEELPLFRLLHTDGREEVAQRGEGGLPPEIFPVYALLKGIPLLEDIRGELPQSVGLLPLVDYGKGCYVGQEIMARTEGKEVPYRLVGLEVLEPGERGELFLEGKRVGAVKRLEETPFGHLGLGLVRKEVPLGTVVTGGGGAYLLLAYPFEEALWSGQRSSA